MSAYTFAISIQDGRIDAYSVDVLTSAGRNGFATRYVPTSAGRIDAYSVDVPTSAG